MITELPCILPSCDTTTRCNHLISNCLAKERKSLTGADMRRVVIQIYLLLKDLVCSSNILLLLQTIIKINEILYSRENTRSPRQLFQLYNSCWLHMELCLDSNKRISRSKMFGHYLHVLTAHSPTQYELASLRSPDNREPRTTLWPGKSYSGHMHKPSCRNIIPQIMICLQTKREQQTALILIGES